MTSTTPGRTSRREGAPGSWRRRCRKRGIVEAQQPHVLAMRSATLSMGSGSALEGVEVAVDLLHEGVEVDAFLCAGRGWR